MDDERRQPESPVCFRCGSARIVREVISQDWRRFEVSVCLDCGGADRRRRTLSADDEVKALSATRNDRRDMK
jgi:hypothetical protein